MQRTWLQDDLHQIQRYFPGARSVAIRTPFDLTNPPLDPQRQVLRDTFQDINAAEPYGDMLWMH